MLVSQIVCIYFVSVFIVWSFNREQINNTFFVFSLSPIIVSLASIAYLVQIVIETIIIKLEDFKDE